MSGSADFSVGYEQGHLGVIVIRLKAQSADAVNRVLGRFVADPATAGFPLERSVVVIDERRTRITTRD